MCERPTARPTLQLSLESLNMAAQVAPGAMAGGTGAPGTRGYSGPRAGTRADVFLLLCVPQKLRKSFEGHVRCELHEVFASLGSSEALGG